MLFYNADIVMSPHGTGLINIMFSIPHSTLIECFAPYHYSRWYINTASLSSIHYIGVTSYIKNANNITLYKNAEVAYSNGNFNIDDRKYRDVLTNPSVISIYNAVRDAIDYTNRWRFVYETTDKWSPIFFYSVCYQSLECECKQKYNENVRKK